MVARTKRVSNLVSRGTATAYRIPTLNFTIVMLSALRPALAAQAAITTHGSMIMDWHILHIIQTVPGSIHNISAYRIMLPPLRTITAVLSRSILSHRRPLVLQPTPQRSPPPTHRARRLDLRPYRHLNQQSMM